METTWRFKVDDSDVEQSMLRQIELVEKNTAEYKQLEKDATEALQAIADNTAKTSKQLDEYAGQVEKTAKKTKEAEQETGRFGQGIKRLIGNINIGGKNIGDLVDSLENLRGSSKSVAGGLESAGGSAGKFSKAIGVAKLGLLAIVAVIIGVVAAAFAKFQGNLDRGRILGAQFKAGLDVSLKAIGTWGNALIKSVTGQQKFSDAISEAREATKDFNKELREQIKLEGQLEKQLISLERQQKIQAASKELQRQEIERLNLIADDETKTFRTRLAAAQKRQALASETGKLEERNALKLIALNSRVAGSEEGQLKRARQIVEGVRNQTLTFEELAKQIAKTGISEVEAFKKAEDVLKNIETLGDVQEQLFTLQSESQNQATQIRNEARNAAEQQAKALDDAQKRLFEILRITTDADTQIGGAGRAAAQSFANATDEVVKLQDEYIKLSRLLGTGETEADIESLFQPLKDIAAIDFEKASFGQSLETVTTGLDRLIKIATDPLTENITDLVASQTAKPLADRLRENGLEAGKALGKAIQQGQAIQQEQANQQARDLLKGLSTDTINAFFEAQQTRFELQIAQQDAIIAKIEERLSVEQKALEEQQKLADEGLANDVGTAKKRVAEQERLLRDSENKKLEIERKAANQRKIIAAGQQAVELTLAVAKLISAEASKGLIGLVLAVGGLAIISRLVAAGRSQAAAEAGRTQNFATGTERVRGEGTWTSDSVPVNLSKDERVIKSSDNAKLGFERMSNKQLVHYALLGQRVHTDPLFAFAMGLRGQQSKLEESKLSLQVDVMKDAYKEAALLAAEKQIDYWRTRPIEKRNEAGEKYIEWQEGNRVIRQFEVVE